MPESTPTTTIISSMMSGVYELEPQSTSIPSGSGSGSTSGSSNNAPPNISSNPSLILAFLALSFFTMAMIFIFGFRRYQYFHERLYEVFGREGAGAGPNRRSSLLLSPSEEEGEMVRLRRMRGTRPVLWDVCTESGVRWCDVKTKGGVAPGMRLKKDDDTSEVSEEEEAVWNWGNVMPLSACKLVNAERTRRSSLSRRRRFWPFGRTTPPQPPPPSPAGDIDKGLSLTAAAAATTTSASANKPPTTTTTRLRLAVLVAMPCERFPIYYDHTTRKVRVEDSSNTSSSSRERGTFGYEIGLYDGTIIE